jgi:orotidine-5'-phosphate decarboxylase
MQSKLSARDRLIVALDFDTQREAISLVEKLGDSVGFYKVGWQLFFGTHFDTVKELAKLGKKVFLDLKMTDIPQTVKRAIRNAPAEYVEFLELMTLEGVGDVVAAAKSGATNHGHLKFLMLTVLSSLDDNDIKELYGPQATLSDVIHYKAQKAIGAGCDGLVASGESVRDLRAMFGNQPIIVTPGIRPSGTPVDDHKRSLTPYEAIQFGADYLVVGRPISQVPDPKGAADKIIAEIGQSLCDKAASTCHDSGDANNQYNRLVAAR